MTGSSGSAGTVGSGGATSTSEADETKKSAKSLDRQKKPVQATLTFRDDLEAFPPIFSLAARKRRRVEVRPKGYPRGHDQPGG